ncbi:oocyte-expressed protein homolog [Microtus oregoni]|uniref:oocyte-expressed protein homolog n=1 Tax=Microtus oregoni TaxID=111838 RepID=UPI001BB23C0D|nr:oocyte-expressed protein homolog [Microtus oregoni]
MESHFSDAHHEPKRPMEDPSSQKLRAPPVSWRPQDEICEPVVLHMETWVAERVFGRMQPSVPSEWYDGSIWMTVDTGDSGNVAEITIYGEPSLQRRMKNVILHLEARHKNEDFKRAWTMKELEKFLRTHSPYANRPVRDTY